MATHPPLASSGGTPHPNPPPSHEPIQVPQGAVDPHICAVTPSRPFPWNPPTHPSPSVTGEAASKSASSQSTSASPLELLQVHYFIRHGERTPVRTRMTKSNPPIPARWDMCHAGKEFRAAVMARAGDSSVKFERQGMEFRKGTEAVESDRRVRDLDGECLAGELTDLGRLSTYLLGTHLRRIYIDDLKLLPKTLKHEQDNEKLYVRSTNITRTIESAQQVLRGLLGDKERGTFAPRILIRNGNVENLLPNTYACPTLHRLDGHFSKAVANMLNPGLEKYDALISPHIEGALPRVDGHPRLSGVLDSVRASKAHGIPTPAVFDRPDLKKDVEAAVVQEWFHGYTAEDPEERSTWRRLAMGPLFSDLKERLVERSKGHEDLRMGIYSTHDTTLAGLLATLDCFDQRWPAFTSSVGIELFRDTDAIGSTAESQSNGGFLSSIFSSKGSPSKAAIPPPTPKVSSNDPALKHHYIRLLYNGVPMLIPGCQPSSPIQQTAGAVTATPDPITPAGKRAVFNKEAAQAAFNALSPTNGGLVSSAPNPLCPLSSFVKIVDSLQRPDGMGWEKECQLGRGKASEK